jgi:CRP-like cAMP-binding protein
MFPTLTAAQIARIACHGVIRPITRGEVLIESGQTNVPFFVVKAGEIEVIHPPDLGDTLVAVVQADRFTGGISMILGGPALMRLRVSEPGEVVQRTRDEMHGLIQTDADMSDVLTGRMGYRAISFEQVLNVGGASTAWRRMHVHRLEERGRDPARRLRADESQPSTVDRGSADGAIRRFRKRAPGSIPIPWPEQPDRNVLFFALRQRAQ